MSEQTSAAAMSRGPARERARRVFEIDTRYVLGVGTRYLVVEVIPPRRWFPFTRRKVHGKHWSMGDARKTLDGIVAASKVRVEVGA